MDNNTQTSLSDQNRGTSKAKKLIIFAVVALLVGATALFLALRPYFQTSTLEEINDVTYFQDSHDRHQTLDLLLPRRSGSEKSPMIVWIHGGAWKIGDKKESLGAPFAQQGYAVASINYRLTPAAKFPSQIQDCKAAIRWLRANADKYHIDPDKIGVFGMSAGGHLVALMGVTNDDRQFDDVGGNLNVSSKVDAVCDWSGITDLSTIGEQSTGKWNLDDNTPDAPVKLFLGDRAVNVPEIARQASPVSYVGAKNPPFLIMHGDQDTVVPLAQSKELYTKLKANKADAQLIIVKGGEHNFVSVEALTEVLKFFDSKFRP